MNKQMGVDIDGDGKPDLNLDLKTLILVVGGIISITMTYSTLTKQIELNKAEIEVAKKMPPIQSHEIIDQKLIYLEDFIEKVEEQHDKRIDQLETKVYKR
tara:strand:- start:258 stop:557 length:300 start_codon:yes stop_codon:yes gene_type:complete